MSTDKNQLSFSINEIVIDDKNTRIQDFKPILDGKPETYEQSTIEIGKGVEVISATKTSVEIMQNRFFCVYLEGGDKYPYPDTVFDPDESKEIKNPRPSDQIELTDQFFAVVDIAKSRLYVSNQKKRNGFVSWLSDKIGKVVEVKIIFKDKEFSETIKSVREISFSVSPNLFSFLGNTLSAELVKDIHGFEADHATVILKYKEKKISDRMKNKIDDLIKRKHEFKDLTIVGRTDDVFTKVFNSDEIVSKIAVPVVPNPDTKKLDEEKVFLSLVTIIEKNE